MSDAIEELKWLISRSDTLRSSYSNRAALVLATDTLILGIVFVILDKEHLQPEFYLLVALALCLVLALSSVVFAFLAVGTLGRSARDVTGSDAPPRFFLSPRETFVEIGEAYRDRNQRFAMFAHSFDKVHPESFHVALLAELHVDLLLQHIRYRNLKISVWLLLMAIVSLTLAFSLFALQWYHALGGKQCP